MADAMDVDAPPQPPTVVAGAPVPEAPPSAPLTKKQKQARTLAARPWVEKYRPASLDELVAHKEIVGVLRRLIKNDKLPHTLLYGPPGTGKTSTILAAAKDMYGQGYKNMTLELNASDDRGIDVVRNEIKEFAGTCAASDHPYAIDARRLQQTRSWLVLFSISGPFGPRRGRRRVTCQSTQGRGGSSAAASSSSCSTRRT